LFEGRDDPSRRLLSRSSWRPKNLPWLIFQVGE
jgi:hypothetical protein